MANLTIVAHVTAHPDHVDLVGGELRKLVPVTLRERGCVQYDLHRDNEDPAHFMFYETWESRELWQAHMQAPHLTAYMAATEGKVTEFTLFEMTAD